MSDGIYTPDPINAIVLTAGAASSSGTIPAGSELIGIMSTGNAHYRMGKGAQTAIATDPMITNANGLLVVRVPPGADTIAVIQEAAGATISIFRVFLG